MGKLKELLKRAGKGIVITAASVIAGVTLGPIAGAALGGFLSRTMGEIGVAISEEIVGEVIQGHIEDSADGLTGLTTPQKMEEVASEVAERAGVDKEEVQAALQYSLRELQGAMSFVVHQLQEDHALLGEVLLLARETDVKVDRLLDESSQVQDALQEVLSRLDAMECGLDISYRKFIGGYSDPTRLTFERLLIISKLQRQRTLVASGFGIRYDPELYVPRQKEEARFKRFMGDAGMSDRNIFVVLGGVGLGKTWFLSRMSSQSLEMGSPTFFIPLIHGINSLTSLFQVENIPALVQVLDPILREAREHAFFFLDGLDEMDARKLRQFFGALSASRSNSISFIISCRVADWISRKPIMMGSNEIEYYIYGNKEVAATARAMGIATPVSVLMTEFTRPEMEAAMRRYDFPDEIPADLLPLLSKPYVMRLSAQWYSVFGILPSPSSPEFLDLFAGGPKHADSIFRRLGILRERDVLYATVEALIEARAEALRIEFLPLTSESTTYQTLISSGLLRERLDRTGTLISLSPDFQVPLIALAILRYERDEQRIEQMLSILSQWIPDKAQIISRIVTISCGMESVVTEQEAELVRSPHIEIEDEAHVDEPPPESSPPTPRKKELTQFFAPSDSATEEETTARVKPPPRTTTSIQPIEPRAKPTTHPEAVQDLKFLLEDTDLRVRIAATLGMGLVAARLTNLQEGIDILSPLLEDADTDYRTGALWGIGVISARFRDTSKKIKLMQPLVEDWEWAIRRTAAFSIALAACKIDDSKKRMEIIEPLLKADDGQVRAGAAEGVGLGSMSLTRPAEMVPLLKPLLDDSFDDVRGGGSFGLGMVAAMTPDPKESLDALTPLATDGYGKVRGGAIMGMSLVATRIPDASGIIKTVSSLLNDRDIDVRATAGLGLGLASAGMRDPSQMIPVLKQALDDSEEDVRRGAALGIGLVATQLRTHKVMLDALSPLLDGDEHLRGGGAVSLGMVATRFRDPSDTIDLLRPLLEDDERSVRKGALMGMSLAATKLRKLSDRFDLISQYTTNEDDVVRRGAALALGVATSEVNLTEGVVIGESFWGHMPLMYDECIVAGLASSMLLRYGR